ncbi:HAD family phosphatase [candidate division KSB1 bacterium]|nr:HAD family phosphatase [candidate division KSB1 bacterium]
MIKACILDMDGVIVDTEPIHMDSFRLFLADLGLTYTEGFIQSLVGYSTRENMNQIKENYFKNNEFNVTEGIKRRDNLYLNLLSTKAITPCVGIMQLIDYCRKNHIKLAVASSSENRQVITILSRLFKNYKNVFDVIVTGDDVIHKKPAPDIYLQTVSKLNVPQDCCIAFEDSRAGVESAKAAGIICIALKTQYTSAHDLQYADRQINSIDEAITHQFWGY